MGKRKIPREAFAQHEERAAKIRKCLIDQIKRVPEKKVAILLSSGVDSHAILFAALHAGKQVVCYSATLDDRESQDFKGARRTCEILGLPFVPVYLPTDVKDIYNFVTKVIYGPINPGIIVGKALTECLWPVAHVFRKVREKAIITGFNGDTWYCTLRVQKKRWLLGEYKQVVDQFRANLADRHNVKDPHRIMQLHFLKRFKPGTTLYVPYNHDKMFDIMDGMDPIHEGWRPIQKAPARLAFWEEFERCRESVYIHSALQKGDSGIAEHFEKLLHTDLNTKQYKSTIGIYNTFLRQWQDKVEEGQIKVADNIFSLKGLPVGRL